MQDSSFIKRVYNVMEEKIKSRLVIQVERNHFFPILTFSFIWKELSAPGVLLGSTLQRRGVSYFASKYLSLVPTSYLDRMKITQILSMVIMVFLLFLGQWEAEVLVKIVTKMDSEFLLGGGVFQGLIGGEEDSKPTWVLLLSCIFYLFLLFSL